MIFGKTVESGGIFSGSTRFISFPLSSGVQHGLITGSTGTGKTVSTRVLLENFSSQGVPTFMVDVKGDLSGLSESGHGNETITTKIKSLGVRDWKFSKFPVSTWNNNRKLKTTVSKLGNTLLSKMLGLTEAQASVLSICFDVSEDFGKTIVDLDNLLQYLQYLTTVAYKSNAKFGIAQESTIGVIQRKIHEIKRCGADCLFGIKDNTEISDLMCTKGEKGVINILEAKNLIKYPDVYATLILWLLQKFYDELPEVGKVDKPKFMFFIDEAHLLFEGTRKPLLIKIESIVRLIRSKGVGVFFITQSPSDIPENVLNQLGSKIQHGLRAFTPSGNKVIKAVAESFVQNQNLPNIKNVITKLATGQALISFLSPDGVPSPAELVEVMPPRSKILS
jgi:DNA helicase HerA-like ATPase